MNDKKYFPALYVAGTVALVSGALINGPILEQHCDGQLRAGCQGLPPSSYHVDNQDPMRGPMGPPMIASTTSTAGPTGPTGAAPSYSGVPSFVTTAPQMVETPQPWFQPTAGINVSPA